ncbi:hypothetical protein CAL14_20460 [Bordetella genomosp. 9]|uniref:GNAT family N-acetyltransferase n=1 Tax=Bordetella genomosp. 9 TaxID=1416803 RepID=UPI000A28D711|nr:GNAT family N-acetyltransferase [Bordetella genomosp. 9]ARP92364.1 hypothetical protein CAL14_20460 [Bordetella genomosp. 9]
MRASPTTPAVARTLGKNLLDARIEEAALNATVVREQMIYDGWLVRWAPSKARRARSVNVLAASQRSLDEKLAHCAAVYARARQPFIFRITSICPDTALDGQLDRKGFAAIDDTCVMAMPLAGDESATPQATLRYEQADPGLFARVAGQLRDDAPDQVAEHTQRLTSIAVPCTRWLARDEQGRHVAAGMTVLDGDLAGVFDVVVDPQVRGRGYARQLMHRLLSTGREAGARTAYLQVERGNTPARRLYASLGFADRYTYWYRTQQQD